jgi:MSHA pilin protein MshA
MDNQDGFTLIELILVIVVIGILTAIAVPQFVDLSDSAQASQCKENQAAIEAAASIAYADSAIISIPRFPTVLSANMFKENAIPDCPATETVYATGSGYNAVIGAATCPTNIPTHTR